MDDSKITNNSSTITQDKHNFDNPGVSSCPHTFKHCCYHRTEVGLSDFLYLPMEDGNICALSI